MSYPKRRYPNPKKIPKRAEDATTLGDYLRRSYAARLTMLREAHATAMAVEWSDRPWGKHRCYRAFLQEGVRVRLRGCMRMKKHIQEYEALKVLARVEEST